jgi:hypothetical protein
LSTGTRWRTSRLAHGAFGFEFSYERFFHDREKIPDCGNVFMPDVIFDIAHNDPGLLQLLSDEGFRIVFERDQSEVKLSDWLPGGVVYRDSFIAVRRELVHELKISPLGCARVRSDPVAAHRTAILSPLIADSVHDFQRDDVLNRRADAR